MAEVTPPLSPISLKKAPVPGGTGNTRISLIPRGGSEWNRKVPIATLSGVECHSSPGAKHRRRSAPELNAESRLHRPHWFNGNRSADRLLDGRLDRFGTRGLPDPQR